MIELHWTEVEGVATVWVDSPPPLRAGLLFRTGRADETLVTSGRTHLLEHLVLATMGEVAPNQNGQVTGVFTGFHAMGAPEEIAAFVQAVCRSLGFLSSERLEDEKQVLEAEAARRSYDLVGNLLNWRYSAAGHGLLGMREIGILDAALNHLEALAATRFTRGNAVLWLSGPPPAGLRLHLPAGVKQPLPPLVPIRTVTPSWYIDDASGGVAAGSTGPRTSAATIFCTLANKRLHDRLRTQRAVSYAPQLIYEPLDADTAHLVLYADSEPERRAELTREFVDEFDLMGRYAGPAFEEARKQVLDQCAGPLTPPPDQLAMIEVQRAAMDWIFGREFQTLEVLAAELSAVRPSEVQAYGSGLQDEALFALPGGALLRPSMGRSTPLFRGEPVRGRKVSHVDAPVQRTRLIYGPEGVTLLFDDGSQNTIRYLEVAAAVCRGDGSITLVNSAAGAITVEPELWRNGVRVAEEIRARIPERLIVDQGTRPASVIPEPKTTKWERLVVRLTHPLVLLLTFLAIGVAVAVLIKIQAVFDLFLLVGLVFYFAERRRRRSGPRPPKSARKKQAGLTGGGLFARFRRRSAREDFAIDSAAIADSILNPSSFSVVVFRGDHGDAIPDLLAACGYSVQRAWTARGNPVSLRDALQTLAGRDDRVVLKAYWSSPEMTVLVDPEMVISTSSEEQLTAFCAERGTEAVAAVWERVSETAILTEIGGSGVTRRTWYQQGRAFDAQVEPRPELKKSADARGLRAALAACGIPVDRLFADADVAVVELSYDADSRGKPPSIDKSVEAA